jgi:hypothetical protein
VGAETVTLDNEIFTFAAFGSLLQELVRRTDRNLRDSSVSRN